MTIENLTSNVYYLGLAEFVLLPEETLVIPDNIYSGNERVSNAVSNLFKNGSILVTDTDVIYSEIALEDNYDFDF